jgi:hypothetical protein
MTDLTRPGAPEGSSPSGPGLGDWLGVVSYQLHYADGRPQTVIFNEQIVPFYALQPRTDKTRSAGPADRPHAAIGARRARDYESPAPPLSSRQVLAGQAGEVHHEGFRAGVM